MRDPDGVALAPPTPNPTMFQRRTGEAFDPTAPPVPSAEPAPAPLKADTGAPDARQEAVQLQRTGKTPPFVPPPPISLPNLNTKPTNEVDPLKMGELVGEERFKSKLRNPPSFAGGGHTVDWYRWVLSLPGDKNDPEYSQLLQNEQTSAADALRAAGIDNPYGWLKNGKTNTDAAALGKQNNADRKEAGRIHAENMAQRYGGMPNVVNAFGEPVDPREVMKLTGGQKPGVSSNAVGAYVDQTTGAPGEVSPSTFGLQGALGHQGPIDPHKLMRSGKVVYMGTNKTMTPYGVEVDQPSFMSIDDAKLMVGQWQPEQIAGFQKAMKLTQNGLPDDPTQKKWAAIVDTANFAATSGRPMTLQQAYEQSAQFVAKAAGGSGGSGGSGGGGGGRSGGRSGGSGGSGGGGGGGALVPAGQARQFLTQYMKQYVGREANDAEAAAFAKAINGAAADPNFDAQNFATQWIQSHNGGEGGAYQSATSYYHAAMQALQNGM